MEYRFRRTGPDGEKHGGPVGHFRQIIHEILSEIIVVVGEQASPVIGPAVRGDVAESEISRLHFGPHVLESFADGGKLRLFRCRQQNGVGGWDLAVLNRQIAEKSRFGRTGGQTFDFVLGEFHWVVIRHPHEHAEPPPGFHAVAFGKVEMVVFGHDPVVERGKHRLRLPVVRVRPSRPRDGCHPVSSGPCLRRRTVNGIRRPAGKVPGVVPRQFQAPRHRVRRFHPQHRLRQLVHDEPLPLAVAVDFRQPFVRQRPRIMPPRPGRHAFERSGADRRRITLEPYVRQR